MEDPTLSWVLSPLDSCRRILRAALVPLKHKSVLEGERELHRTQMRDKYLYDIAQDL